jgi:HAD superfamily hydrolase (TIGR01509 family)
MRGLLILCVASFCGAAAAFSPRPTSARQYDMPRTRCSPVLAATPKSLVIWDCDGVLVDSEALLKTAEVEALVAAGFTDVTNEDCNRLFSGYAPEAGEARFLEEYGKPLPEHFFRDQIANSAALFRERLQALNGKTVLALHALGRKQVVASGSPRDRVEVCLEVAGIDQCFTPDQIFTREDVPGRGKPEPDMFLLAAQKMGVEPADCIVVEDSTAGVRAAQAANMEVVGFLGGGHAKADWYREKLASFDIPLTYSDTELLEFLS